MLNLILFFDFFDISFAAFDSTSMLLKPCVPSRMHSTLNFLYLQVHSSKSNFSINSPKSSKKFLNLRLPIRQIILSTDWHL